MILHKTSRVVDGRTVAGAFLHAFIHNGGTYFYTPIGVYEDGMIDCWGLVDFGVFKQKVAQGWVVTTLPEGARVSLGTMVHLSATDVQTFVREDNFVKEVADVLAELRHQPTSSDLCLAAYERFEAEQSRRSATSTEGRL